ncbi:topoisomerase DNA-binding C4 zinc finger domain-containing protein [Thermovibrio ammonificans]|jgi:ssDNA-binding Zn-finger/Zn-ribbon topoisomerase 1
MRRITGHVTKAVVLKTGVVKLPTFGYCPKCGAALKLVEGPFGKFTACSNPACPFVKRVKGEED